MVILSEVHCRFGSYHAAVSLSVRGSGYSQTVIESIAAIVAIVWVIMYIDLYKMLVSIKTTLLNMEHYGELYRYAYIICI
jgi:hypothetical protein